MRRTLFSPQNCNVIQDFMLLVDKRVHRTRHFTLNGSLISSAMPPRCPVALRKRSGWLIGGTSRCYPKVSVKCQTVEYLDVLVISRQLPTLVFDCENLSIIE